MNTKPEDVQKAFSEVVEEWGAEKLLAAAQSHATTHVKLMLTHGVTAQSLAHAIDSGDEVFWLGLLELLPQMDEQPLAVELALLAARCPEMRSKDKLMWMVLHTLLVDGREETFLVALPLSFHRWYGGAQTSLQKSTYPGRATALIDHLETQVVIPDAPPWPRLGQPESTAPKGEFLMHAKQIAFLFDVATPAEQKRMRAFATRCFSHAATWRERVFAAQALIDIQEYAPLLDRLDDADTSVRGYAFEVALRLDPKAYFERALEDGTSKIAENACMHMLRHDPVALFDALGACLRPYEELSAGEAFRAIVLLVAMDMTRSEAVPWFVREPRWIKALAQVRGKLASHNYTLDRVLSSIPRETLEAFFGSASEPAVRQFSGRDNGSSTWLERYDAGEHERVWNEIEALGDTFGSEAEVERAREVAMAMMVRVRRNAWKLLETLRSLGYAVPEPDGLRKLNAKPRLPKAIETLRTIGPVPLALEAFYAVVGTINLVPEVDRPVEALDAQIDDLDPMQVLPPASLKQDFEQWKEECELIHSILVGPLVITLAPDRFTRPV